MKNVHMFPTNKPSRLLKDLVDGNLKIKIWDYL